jgi:hypothetical protein
MQIRYQQGQIRYHKTESLFLEKSLLVPAPPGWEMSMKKGLIITLAILLLLAVAFYGGYVWVQRRVTREMNAQLQKAVRPYVGNPQNLTLTNKPVRVGRDKVRVSEVEINGTDLQFPHELEVASMHVVIRDVEVDVRGKRQKLSHVGDGSFEITLSADDLTGLFRRQQAMSVGGLRVLPETLILALSRQNGIEVTGEGTEPPSADRLPFTLRGSLVPDTAGEMTFRVGEIAVDGQSRSEPAGKSYPLPAANLLPSALKGGRVQAVSVGDGAITFTGTFDGAQFLQNR